VVRYACAVTHPTFLQEDSGMSESPVSSEQG
jgi:hypothetical protein